MESILKELTAAFGPAGDEGGIQEVIKHYLTGYVDEFYTDTLGNLIALKKGSPPNLMLAAHMDELGLMVTHIDEEGFLRFAGVGGINPYHLVGQRFIFANGTRATVNHEKIDKIQELTWTKLFMDLGVSSREEAKELVRIGDSAVYDQPLKKSQYRYLGKSLDDRAGCAVILETLRRLPQSAPQNIAAVFTVQEELGLRGARTAAYHLQPSYGIAVDVTRVGDTPKAPTMDVSLGKGPAIKIKDSSIITHPQLRNDMIKLAEEREIPYQLEVLERGGTDAGAIHVTREGVPSGVISIPCRYVHTPSEMVDKRDLDYSVDLLEAICNHPWQ